MFLNGGSCGAGTLTTTVETGDSLDQAFALVVVGLGPAPAPSAASRNAAEVKLPD
jgi:hypothetical protein